ncbi:PAS domain S-box protein [Paenibacillus sp.]|uniref:PAS domain S-box protein n=1 Tax=Paenibacillus sp. TaxID=58172 RepID=UPI0028127E05|nr:PAS domain S-box protein [Paenibacillus sp.]
MPNPPFTTTPLFSLEQHRFLLEQLPDPVTVYTGLCIVYANPAAAAVVGARSSGQLIGRSILDFVPPEYRTPEAPGIPSQLEPSGEPVIGHWLRLDGYRVTVQTKSFPILYDGEPSVLMICKDMTAEIGYEQSLRRNEQLLLNVVQYSPEAIVLHADEIVYYANDATVRMFRAFSASELIGRNIYDFIHKDFHEAGKRRLSEAQDRIGARLDFTVHKFIRLDGETFDAEVSSVVIENTDDRFGGRYVQTVLRDVTERIAREKELLDHSQRFERLLKFLPEPIVITDRGAIIYCNKSTAKLVRASSKDEIIGKSIFDFIHSDHHQNSAQVVRDVMQTYDATPFQERQIICCDGSVISVEISSIRIDHYNGKSVTLSVMRDLTERKEAEELLIRSEKLSVIGQLAAGVAHEIRNPLTSLRGFTQLLRRELDPARFYYIETMLSELDRMTYIVNDFMSLSKPQLVAYRNHDLADTLRAVLLVIESEALLHNITVHWDHRGGLPPVRCDEHRMKQVFLNVLKNAIDAMPDGGAIHLKMEAVDDELLVRIRDEGPGMPKELIDRIGDPFFTTKSDGTGLGLMICHRIVEAHRGSIRFTSAPGAGTTVDIFLPIATES